MAREEFLFFLFHYKIFFSSFFSIENEAEEGKEIRTIPYDFEFACEQSKFEKEIRERGLRGHIFQDN